MIYRLSAMLIFPIVSIFANHNYCAFNETEAPAILQIVTKQAEAIEHYNGLKLYLKSEKIHHTNHGPMICNADSIILLQNLSVDQMGCYLLCRSKDDYKFTCPNCGKQWWFSDTWSVDCPVCDTPGE